jgi:methyl-accepting chemotaxis protein
MRNDTADTTAIARVWEGFTAAQAWDHLATPVIVSDADMVIRYVNKAAEDMFRPYEADIRKDLPDFAVDRLVGQNVDAFHRHPPHQRGIVAGMSGRMTGTLSAGGRHYAFSASPVWGAEGALAGAIIEWRDDTAEQAASREARRFVQDVDGMARAHAAGQTDHFLEATGYSAENASVLAKVNEMVSAHIDIETQIIDCVRRFAEGDFDATLKQMPGQLAFINEGVDSVRENFRRVIADMDRAARALMDGDFERPVQNISAKGQFANLFEAMERVRASLFSVTTEIGRLSTAMMQGELDVQIDPTAYRGGYRRIIESFDAAFDGLNGAFARMGTQIQQVAQTVEQMSQSSQSLATNSQIQSSSVDQVSSSAEETDEQVKSNAAAATTASQLVTGASEVAEGGKAKINEMVQAMEGIRASSQDIAKIIKVIDEIAFQTNLLALNAAVEAARAGQHGRGFAVVAQEVRNLAGRSAKAARETSDLIEDASTRVQAGVKIADETSRAFVSIADDILKVKSLVRDIATASGEQSRGVAQINLAIGEVAKSALSTSQQAEELAASAAEMQAATESMLAEVGRFRLRRRAPQTAAPGISFDGLPAELMAQIQAMIARQTAAAPAAPNFMTDRDSRGYANF